MRFFFDMNRYARTAESKNFKIIPIDLPFSLFDFVDNHFKGLSSLRRILSQVRINGGKTMVIEEIGGAGDIIEENEDIKTRYPDFNKSTTYRLSFFKKKFSTKRGLSTSINSDFIGYAIVNQHIKERPIEAKVVVAGKQPNRVRARSVLAYWAIRDLGLTATEVGKYLGLSKSAVSRAATRGQKLIVDQFLPAVSERLETRNFNPVPLFLTS